MNWLQYVIAAWVAIIVLQIATLLLLYSWRDIADWFSDRFDRRTVHPVQPTTRPTGSAPKPPTGPNG